MWEYKVIGLPSPADATNEQVLNVLGAEGWELVGQVDCTAFLKRHKNKQFDEDEDPLYEWSNLEDKFVRIED